MNPDEDLATADSLILRTRTFLVTDQPVDSGNQGDALVLLLARQLGVATATTHELAGSGIPDGFVAFVVSDAETADRLIAWHRRARHRVVCVINWLLPETAVRRLLEERIPVIGARNLTFPVIEELIRRPWSEEQFTSALTLATELEFLTHAAKAALG